MKLFFAPLQGYTEAAYRKAHEDVCSGVDAYFSPFLRLEHGQIRRRDLRDINREINPGNLIPQVIAADVKEFTQLCDAVISQGYRRIDANMGCPFPPQVKAGRGAGLLPRADAVKDICDEIKRYSSDGVAFSVKMRLGQETKEEGLAVLDVLNDTPLEFVTVHPRLGKQQYKGDVEMDAFNEFYDRCKHPVVYNGGILSVDDINRIETLFPDLAGVMIGRGLLARPTLAAEYRSGAVSDDVVRQSVAEIHGKVLAQYMETLEGGDAQILSKIQPFWEYPGHLFDKKVIKHMSKTGSLVAYLKLIPELK